MNTFHPTFRTHKRLQKLFFSFFCCAIFFGLLLFSGCQKKVNYFEYVSENRSNVLLAEDENFSLKVYALKREIPYLSDGIPKTTSTLTEIRLAAPSGEKTYEIFFTVKGKTYGGETSYDNVKSEYFYSCSLDVSKESEIPFEIKFEDTVVALNAKSVRTDKTLSPEKILFSLRKAENGLFRSMTDEYGFKGEIYIRLIFEESPYYYIGVIGRDKKTYAFLLNAETGKILAKRES